MAERTLLYLHGLASSPRGRKRDLLEKRLGPEGFRVAAGNHQPELVIYLMRVLLSFIPLVFVGAAMILLWRFPLSRARMHEVNAELEKRRGTI